MSMNRLKNEFPTEYERNIYTIWPGICKTYNCFCFFGWGGQPQHMIPISKWYRKHVKIMWKMGITLVSYVFDILFILFSHVGVRVQILSKSISEPWVPCAVSTCSLGTKRSLNRSTIGANLVKLAPSWYPVDTEMVPSCYKARAAKGMEPSWQGYNL